MPIEDLNDFDKNPIKGMVFEITPEELEQADAYEVDAYKRERISLLSGDEAWAYVSSGH
jgi:gamma-glutamylcyclotransferase (GGCT)/AIG2-like uncharacterized protein YtfP